METKICGKCKQEKPVSEFYKSARDGYRSRCIPCHKEDRKIYAQTGYYSRYQRKYNKRPEGRRKSVVRWFTNQKKRSRKIQSEPCAYCGCEQSQVHHLDYAQPLLILWLCIKCHNELHLKE